uniref:Uncharacterized protein n=1 Tax=Meloidogyne incognita TaxID=6306 RepID=A0A914MRN1_MELIC
MLADIEHLQLAAPLHLLHVLDRQLYQSIQMAFQMELILFIIHRMHQMAIKTTTNNKINLTKIIIINLQPIPLYKLVRILLSQHNPLKHKILEKHHKALILEYLQFLRTSTAQIISPLYVAQNLHH